MEETVIQWAVVSCNSLSLRILCRRRENSAGAVVMATERKQPGDHERGKPDHIQHCALCLHDRVYTAGDNTSNGKTQLRRPYSINTCMDVSYILLHPLMIIHQSFVIY